ncbi:ABC transporter permease [Aestuariivirga sp.]|uniref:ABC transporter permease n=1 Tax=Aestuariivirga sp. TaxID=2650926 RepID=UPI0039E5787B
MIAPLLWLRYAAKNLRSGLKGFWIYLSCLTLGVAAIAIVGSLVAAVDRGLTEQGQPLLGGDVEFSLIHREANANEQGFMASKGTLSRIATLRGMAMGKEQSTLVEIKAVDKAYPLYGTLGLEPGGESDPLAVKNGVYGIAADPLLLGRLGLKLGDDIKIGSSNFRLAAVIANEPDRISDGFVLGPRVLMSHEALQTTGLIQPGSLITWRYRVKLTGDTSLAAAKAVVSDAEKSYPDAGWRVRARDNAAQGAERFAERLGYFMSLVGIAALVIGGAGIANAVSAFITRQTSSIATLKCIGISNRNVTGLFLTEIILVGLIGIAIALGIGAAAPFVMKALFGDVLPLPLATSISWQPLFFAALLGLLVTLAAASLPLARIGRIQGAALFRSSVVDTGGRPSLKGLAVTAALMLTTALVILANFPDVRVTGYYLLGLVGAFILLAGLAWLLMRIVASLPRPRNIYIRHALLALHRPGASAVSVILALGLGLTLFVALALTDRTISKELRSGLPQKAPSFFVLDVQNSELPAFREMALKEPGVTAVNNAPMLRGRITAVNGVPADQVKVAPDAAWALRGDRGLTYSETVPEGSTLVAGDWWPKDYDGSPRVSVVDDIAKGLALKLGDRITVNVLGREITAEVTSFRQVNWRSMGINFVMVFSPNTLKAAPHSHVVTIEMSGGDEARFLNDMARAFPSATAVRVKDALATVSDLLARMLAAVRGANVLTLLTGVLVLSGALAASLAARSYEAVVLKTYGATRRQLLLAFMLEYGLLGLVAALFGMIVGSLGAWYLSSFILELGFAFSWPIAVATALLAMVLTVGAGLAVTARALSVKPSAHLRNE